MNDGQSNHGFLWILQNEQKYRSVFVASSDFFDPQDHPKLVVTYQPMKKYFYLKDHPVRTGQALGNIRVTLNDQGNLVTKDDYYPFGLQMPGLSYNNGNPNDNRKYSSKELDKEHGLDWYYFGARYYDPAIGRWMSMDPLANDYPSWSPYNYSIDEPISKNDPDGKFVWGAVIGFATDYALQSIKSGNWGLKGKNWGSLAISTGAGLVSGGVSGLTKMANLSKVLKAGINVAANSGLSILEGYTKSQVSGSDYEVKDALIDGTIGVIASGAGEAIHLRNAGRLEGVAEKGIKAERAAFKARGVNKNPHASLARKARYNQAAAKANAEYKNAVNDFWKATKSENLKMSTNVNTVTSGVLQKWLKDNLHEQD